MPSGYPYNARMVKEKTMRKSTTRQKRATQKRSIGKKIELFLNRVSRFAGRINWPSLTLRGAATIALVAVECAVAAFIGHLAGDAITTVILVSTALMGGLGIVLGPQVIPHLRSQDARKWAWRTILACLAVSLWNLSTTLHNADAAATGAAIRSSASYPADVARLAHLNAMIDALGDETGYGGAADQAYSNNLAERDRLDERLAKANPQPAMIAAPTFWLKAGLFHSLVFGFSAFFGVPMKKRRAAKKTGKAVKAPRGQPNWAANF